MAHQSSSIVVQPAYISFFVKNDFVDFGVISRHRKSGGTLAITTTNPATGQVLKTFESLARDQIEQKLKLAPSAFQTHRRISFAERGKQHVARGAAFLNQNGGFPACLSEESRYSRHGRELGEFGIREFMNTEMIHLQ